MTNQPQSKFFFDNGIKAFKKKEYEKSINFFLKANELDPKNVLVLNALGVAYGIIKKHDIAKDYFEKSLIIDSFNASTISNYAISLYEMNDFKTALKFFNQLPDNHKSSYQFFLNIGNCNFNLQNYEIAMKNYMHSIKINPKNYEAYLNIGIIKKSLKEYDVAREFLTTAYQINQNDFLINFHLADICMKFHAYDDAIKFLKKTISIDEQNLDAVEKLGFAYLESKKYEEARNIFHKLLKKDLPNQFRARVLVNLSTIEIRINDDDFYADYSLPFEYAKEALDLDPNSFGGLSNIGICYLMMSDFNNSVLNLKKALDLIPDSFAALKNLGTTYNHIGAFDKAEIMFKKLKKTYPEYYKMDFSLCTALLSQSKFSEGWKLYEYRWYEKHGAPFDKRFPAFTKQRWKPELGYKRILIWGEQGLGDQILHGTILNDFTKQFKEAYLAIDPRLVDFFQSYFPNIKVFSLFDDIKQDLFDYHIPLCSMAYYMRNSLNDFLPLKVPYLKKKEKLNDANTKTKKLRCAITWKSVKGSKSDYKSMELKSLRKILQIPEIDFYNIQYTNEDEEVLEFKEKYGITIHSPDGIDTKNDINGLVNFIHSCDFVISISNTNAHLACSIGKPTYLLLSDAYGKIWYWDNMHEGKNVWYPTVEIFIQKVHRDWEYPVDQVYKRIKEKYNLK